MPADITKYGISGLKGLKGVNTNVDPEYQEALQYRNRTLRGSSGPTLRDTFSTFSYGEGSPMNDWGTSGYDNEIMNTPLTSEQVQDTRYENQPWYDTLANGVGKMLGTAATTFASSLFGLPYGLIRTGAAAVSGEENPWANLWDNEITQGLSEVEDWMEKNMTNYRSTEQQNAPWYSPVNLGSMNFIADDIIKNAGFMLGAAASMAVGSGALGLLSKAAGVVNKASSGTKIANGFLSALFSATGEGMIEAKQGVDERNKLEFQKFEDFMAPERQALQNELNAIEQDYALTGDYATYKERLNDYTQKKDYFDRQVAEGRQQIEDSGREMGNKILLGNQALLTAGNLIQFGKLMTKSFNNARHAAETASKSVKPSMWRDGFTATRNSADDITKGYAMSSKNLGRLRAGTKGLLTEGSEEMNQQWIQSSAAAAYNERDLNDYWKAKLDQKSYRDTTEGLYTLGNVLSQGFNESWGDANQWEQFVIGGLTGMAGSYSPTKLFNQDKTKSRWDPRRYGSWEGGAVNEIKDFNEQYNQYAENINDLNKILDQENFGARVQNLIAHSFLERRKEQAAKDNDMKTWKDEDDKQTVHDIQAFYRAGKIDDLRTLYNEMSQNMSDDDIESIVKRTTKVTTAEEDRNNYYTALDEEIEKKQQNVDDLYNQLESVQADYGSGNISEDEAQSKTRDLTSKISNAEAEVGRLTEERKKKDTSEGYNGSVKYEGPYVDITGNQIKTNDEIREEVKHNSEELNRKLDSYLDSVEQVNRDTGGRVSKDQEDNLAYLHFMGRESQNRFLKTISKRRADMPQTFLLKTDKTPEKLTEEYGTSDLVFSKNDRTPDGYVEANTSMMTDNDFANFFMREVMWGGNISTEFGETADEKAQREKDEKDTSLSAEEKKKRAMDRFTAKMKAEDERREKEQQGQQSTNVKRMKEDFVRNYRKNNNATVDEALKKWDELKQDVIDASNLLNQAGEYRRTLQEYLMNPQKVDQDKAKEEKKAEKQVKKDEVKGMSVRDLSNRDDLNELFSEAQKENDITLMNKIKKAQVLREKKANLDAADGESNLNGADVSDEENAALEILRQQVENDIDDDSTIDDKKEQTAKELTDLVADVDEGLIDSYVDEHAVVNIDPKTGAKTLSLKRGTLSPEERSQQAQFEAENPEEYDRQKTVLIDRIHNSIRSIDDRMSETLSKIDDTDIVSEDVAKMQKYTDKVKEDENLPDIEPEKKNDRNNPVQTVPNTPETPIERRPVDGIGEEAALTSDMRQGTENGLQISSNSGQHPWQIVSGRVGYHTNEPYSNTLRKLVEDPNVSEENKKIYRKQLKRAEAVEKFLSNEESGAYTRVENGGAQRRSTVKFKVFRKVNEAAEDFVIFITDDKGNILGDLPSSDPDIDPNTEKRTGLAALYEEARKQLDENADATELELKGIESEIDFEYIGKPQYRKEGEPRKTVNELFNNGEFTLALKVSDNNEDNPVVKVDTGKKSFKGKLEMDAIKDPLTGNVGQPYILIPTSQAARKNNTGRGYWAVPIATPAFGEIDKSSVFYRTVKQTLESIRDGKLSETEAKTKLGELFGVANFHVNFTEGESKKEPGIRATTYIRQDGSEKGAPHTLYVGDRASMDVETVLNELGRFFINISNSKINSKETYTTVDGTSYTYNQMIGEIATTDTVRPHTVNDWFTIRPVEKKGNKWVKSETPTQRIPYPSGSEKAVFHVTIPYQDGTKHVWTISPKDWTVRDEQGRPIMFKDGIHSEEEANVAAIHMARAFGRYYMKDMSKPYVVLVGEQSRLFDPTNNTFKAAQELEEAPRYRKGQSFSSAEAEYDFLTTIEQARAEKAAGGGTSNNNAQENKAVEDIQLSVEELSEMEQIKKGAIADGTFMKAPNGKPTNLTERQWLQVRTKNFINWFGDWINDPANASKVVDENGEPLVVYHGSKNGDFTIFDYDYLNKTDSGFFFTSDKSYANNFGNTREFFLNIKNPNITETYLDLDSVETLLTTEYEIGTDGIIGHDNPNTDEDIIRSNGIEYVAIRSNQIKSATDNELANISTLESTKDRGEAQKAINRERTEATIKKIKEDSADFVLADGNGNEDPNGDYYKNKKTGELHARVTSVKEGDTRVLPFKETDEQGNRNPWITPSTTIGNAVDEFVRLFFEGQDPESSVLTQNLSDKTKQHLREELEKIQKSLGTKWKVAASGIKAVGNITVKDANGDDMVIRVAGTLDLLLYNPEKNEYAIYDMKTHRGGVEDKKLGWAAQLSLYKQLLEARYPEMRGKIKGLKIVPFTTSGYDANKQSYDTDDSGRLTSNGEIVKAEVKYDGSTIDMTKDEMNLNISFARPGFKKEYVSGVGASKIIVSKPQPKLEEAPKERVKEGFVKSINKIASNDSVKTFLKPKFRDNKEAITLSEKLDKARKDGNLGELCLTLGEMNLLQDMLNTRMIDRVAARSEMINRGLDVPAAETPEADVAEGSQDIDAIAEEKGILSTATRKAWNKLTDENKEKIVQLRRGVKDVKRELKECQRLGKDPNSAIAGYLHRKADETSGYTIIDMKKELAWLDKVLPKLSKESRVRIIEGLIKCSDGTFDYGQIKQGLIYIATNGKEGTVYHEAFHAVTQWILTDNELDRLYKAAKERYGNLDTVVLEEKLADDFMRYTMGFEPSYKKHNLNIFQKLWQAIKNMFKHTSMIDKLYRDINDGIYADSVLRTNNNEFAHITEEDRQVSMKYQFLDKEQQQRLKDEKISQEQYEVLDADEKRYLFHCVI